MGVPRSVRHCFQLLDRLDVLRKHGSATDLVLVSTDGQHYNVHSLVILALDMPDLLPTNQCSVHHIDCSGTALAIFIAYLYAGILDMPAAKMDTSTANELEHLARKYKLSFLLDILRTKPNTETAIKRKILSQDQHVNENTPGNIVEEKQCEEKYSNASQNLIHCTEGETEPETKQLLKQFLNKKAQCVKTDSTTECQRQDTKSSNTAATRTMCCDICGKVIAKKGFPTHRKVHLNIKEKTCEICGKRFRKACNLQEHWQRMHSSRKLHCCSRCGATFAIMSDLRRHVARHEKTCFVCELCGASFVGKMMWKKHKCMDDLFCPDDFGAVLSQDNPSIPSSQDNTQDDILNISTLLPFDFNSDCNATEILSEVDGLFYDNA